VADLRLTWTLTGRGWASCAIGDSQAEVVLTASYVSAAPEELLTAVARLLAGGTQAEARFEAEPSVFRWIFTREGAEVSIRVLQLPDRLAAETEIWRTRQPLHTLARVTVRCFDDVARKYPEYDDLWGRPFPHSTLETLRTGWRQPTSG
jgi:hypothetical protein